MSPLRPETSLAWYHHSFSQSASQWLIHSVQQFTTTRPVAAFGG